MAFNLYTGLNVPVTLQVNSIGDAACRPTYIKALLEYYRKHRAKLCESCLVRLSKSPLRLFDCKEEQCQPLKAGAPQFVDHLCENCRDHFTKFLEYLDELDIPYVLNAQLVRGLDYYTRTVFEIWSQDDEQGRVSLGGGGRYDNLIEQTTGMATPAVGGSIGLDRLLAALEELDVISPQTAAEVIVFNLDKNLTPEYLNILTNLRNAGLDAEFYYEPAKLDKQFKYAEAKNTQVAVIMGSNEAKKRKVNLKNLKEKQQITVDLDDLITEVKSMLW